MPRTERPLSPSIQHYRPQLTSVLSITHRLTGLILSVGALLLVGWLVAAAMGPRTYAGMQAFLGSPLGLVLVFVWTFSFFYHLLNGIRHLFWDLHIGFSLAAIYITGWAVVIMSILLTLLCLGLGLYMRGAG